MKLRVLAFALAILAFFIFVGSPFEQAATAIVGVDDAIIAIIIAALAAIGITFVTTGGYRSLNEYVGSLMEEYASEQGVTVNSQLRGVQSGTSSLGKLLLNNRFVVYIQVFGAWLKNKFSLTNNSTISVVQAGYNIGDFVAYGMPFQWRQDGYYINGYEYIEFIASKPVFVILGVSNNGWTQINFLSKYANNSIIVNTYHNDTLNNSQTYDLATYWPVTEYYSYAAGQAPNDYSAAFTMYDQSLINQALNGNSGDMSIDQNNIGIDIETGTITLPYDDPNYTAGDGAVLDVGADWGEDYGTVTGVTIPGEFSDGRAGEAEIEYQGEDTVQDQVEDTPQQSISQEVSDYQVSGLASVFPFCIPFDLYNFVSCLAADPVAPSFTWRFYVPGICDESIEIDLSEFDAAAQILRTMELLLFCVGLAFVTRKIIRG